MRKLLFLLCFYSSLIYSQDPRLAQQYYNDGEYEKAATLYQSMYQKNPNNDNFFNRYVDCLMALKQFSECEDIVRKEINRKPKEVQLYVTYGNLLIRRNDPDKAEKQFLDAVDKLTADVSIIHRLANAFIQITRYDLAIKTYEKGEKLMKSQTFFTYNLADLYRRKGDLETMMKYFLDGLENQSVQVQGIQNLLIAYLTPEQYKILQAQIYQRLDKNPESIPFAELLMWSLVQVKEYGNAFRQAKALDRKLNENGNRIFNLAMAAAADNDLHTAIDALNYIREKGVSGSFYHEACRQVLALRRQLIIERNDYKQADLVALETDYQKYKDEFGKNYLSAPLVIEYAELEARYLNNLDKAINLLLELVKSNFVEPHTKAKAKLDLGDYYLITGERWEATLLYSQVDKDFKEDELGELARFKNARLSYFAGDFQWAQEQFDILKRATSRLISNDAIDLSVFIQDNLNQDTTGESLSMYSQAELKVFQNQYDSALYKLNQIPFTDPEIKFLEDDVWFLEAKIYNHKKQTEAAIKKYELILEKHKEEIRADNALYELAQIYDYQLNNKEKAKELYEKLFMEFSNSVLAVEARKRFRILRGDKLQ
ncbi:MAG: tetratricopeptide repeat protein [Saprospiraceae bacterium]|nr:tetratricopeptide repeat protein [Saprospiraceae bacterium]